MVRKLSIKPTDQEKSIINLRDAVSDNSDIVTKIIDDVILKYCSGIDRIVHEINSSLHNSEDIPDTELNYYIAKLPIEMYYLSSCIEDFGVQADITTAIRKEKYDIHYLQSDGKTINEKQSDANRHVVEEELLENAYQRAYKKMKSKLDMADSVLNSLKKVQNYRTVSMELSQKSYYCGGADINPRNRRN